MKLMQTLLSFTTCLLLTYGANTAANLPDDAPIGEKMIITDYHPGIKASSGDSKSIQPKSKATPCQFFHQIKTGMKIDSIKTLVELSSTHSILIGKTYYWGSQPDQFFYLSFFDNGDFQSFAGKVPAPALRQLIDRNAITLEKAEGLMGKGAIHGYMYRFMLNENHYLTIFTDLEHVVRGKESTFFCSA